MTWMLWLIHLKTWSWMIERASQPIHVFLTVSQRNLLVDEPHDAVPYGLNWINQHMEMRRYKQNTNIDTFSPFHYTAA